MTHRDDCITSCYKQEKKKKSFVRIEGTDIESDALAWRAQMMAGWLGALELDDVDIVGQSFGGGVAQWLLLAHRQRIRAPASISPFACRRRARLRSVPLHVGRRSGVARGARS